MATSRWVDFNYHNSLANSQLKSTYFKIAKVEKHWCIALKLEFKLTVSHLPWVILNWFKTQCLPYIYYNIAGQSVTFAKPLNMTSERHKATFQIYTMEMLKSPRLHRCKPFLYNNMASTIVLHWAFIPVGQFSAIHCSLFFAITHWKSPHFLDLCGLPCFCCKELNCLPKIIYKCTIQGIQCSLNSYWVRNIKGEMKANDRLVSFKRREIQEKMIYTLSSGA